MQEIGPALIGELAASQIEAVTFYKRDEVTTDLICCEIRIGQKVWLFHEEVKGWELLIAHLQKLPGFRSDWYAAVVQLPFAASETVAYRRR
jgi:hypothetical protein